MTKELWKPIKGSNNYQVSNNGRIIDDNGTVLSNYEMSTGAPTVWIPYTGLGLMPQHVPVLVAREFYPGFVEGSLITHMDFNPYNNALDNLEIDSRIIVADYPVPDIIVEPVAPPVEEPVVPVAPVTEAYVAAVPHTITAYVNYEPPVPEEIIEATTIVEPTPEPEPFEVMEEPTEELSASADIETAIEEADIIVNSRAPKLVTQEDLEGNHISTYNSISEAERETGFTNLAYHFRTKPQPFEYKEYIWSTSQE